MYPLEIDIPPNVNPHYISTAFMTVVIEQVLKDFIPDEDFSVIVNVDSGKLIINWMGVN